MDFIIAGNGLKNLIYRKTSTAKGGSMARLKIAATILDTAEKWKKRCLLEGGSQFAGPQVVGYSRPPIQVTARSHRGGNLKTRFLHCERRSQFMIGVSQLAGPQTVG